MKFINNVWFIIATIIKGWFALAGSILAVLVLGIPYNLIIYRTINEELLISGFITLSFLFIFFCIGLFVRAIKGGFDD